jgi:hypothetical protein
MEPDPVQHAGPADHAVSVEEGPPAGESGRAEPAAPPPLSRVTTLLRRVERRIRRVTSELDEGRTPPTETLRALREDVEALPPAVRSLERDVAPRLGVPGVHRALRRVLARTGPLVQALARSGPDTPEARRLGHALAALEALVAVEPRTAVGTSPARPGPSAADEKAARKVSPEIRRTTLLLASRAAAPEGRAAGQNARTPIAYTRTAAASALDASIPAGPRTLLHAAAPTATRRLSTLDLAAVALLLALALSASLSCLLMKAGLPAD